MIVEKVDVNDREIRAKISKCWKDAVRGWLWRRIAVWAVDGYGGRWIRKGAVDGCGGPWKAEEARGRL